MNGSAWLVFITMWLFFYAPEYGIFENIAVTIASFLVIAAFNAVFWIPASAGPHASGTRTKMAALLAIGWMIFIVMWWPFPAEFFTLYQNYSITILSGVISLSLLGIIFGTIPGIDTGGNDAKKIIVILYGWSGFLIMWLWFYAGDYSGNYNIAIGILSFTVASLILMAVGRPMIHVDDEDVSPWRPIAVLYSWMGFMILWFWQFADVFVEYQNLAISIISFMAAAAVGYVISRKTWDDLNSLDYEEIEE